LQRTEKKGKDESMIIHEELKKEKRKEKQHNAHCLVEKLMSIWANPPHSAQRREAISFSPPFPHHDFFFFHHRLPEEFASQQAADTNPSG